MKKIISLAILFLGMCSVSSQNYVAVTDKANTRSGNKHNYESLSIYFFPNPASPTGIPYIEKDGQWNPEYKQYDFPRLQELVSNLKNSADAFCKSGDLSQYKYFCKQLDVWFLDSRTRMLPNFDYCQFIPGINGDKGQPGGIIDAKNFTYVIEYIEQVNARKSIGRTRMRRLRRWFGDFAEWMIMSDNGKKEAAGGNNHGVAYDVSLYCFCQFSGKKDICDDIQDRFARMRIETQIEKDGRQPAELKRTRAFFYSAYNIEHMMDFCEALHKQGILYIDGDGALIKEAILYLSAFIGNQSKFQYQEIGSWKEGENILNRQIQRCKAISTDPRIKALK